jgi:outer membrane receptor protein involved in Fe transport
MLDFMQGVARFIQQRIAAIPLLVLLTFVASVPVHAEDAGAKTADFNIGELQLADALSQFGAQSGLQVVYQPDVASGLESKALSGRLTADAALKQLLAGTGLTWSYVNGDTVVLKRAEAKKESEPVRAEQEEQSTANRPSQEPSEKLEEIVVTAQKRAERALDVPISIVAISAEELQKRKVTGVDDLAQAVPGLAIQSSGGDTRRIMLRGVSNLSGTSPLIGLYLDEASVTSSPFTQLDLRTYDLERVEVLRGPQGTLYGEGSVGGTIRFITKDPVLNRFEMNADVAALFTEDGEPSQRVEGVINVPLIDNQLGIRIAGTFDHEGGWINQPDAGRKDFNGQNLAHVRAKGLWQPTSQFTVKGMFVIHRNDTNPGAGEDADGNYLQTFGLTTTPSVRDDYDIGNLTLSYDFPAFRALSTSSYIDQDKASRNLGSRYQYTPPGTPRFDFLFSPQASNKIFNEEIRLTSVGQGAWQWNVGGFYRRSRFGFGSTANYFGFPGPPGTPLPDPYPNLSDSLSKSWAAFADSSYKLSDRLIIGAGLRYFEDEQEFTTTETQVGKFHTTNPRLYLQFKASDNFNTYASAAKGFRSGGFNSSSQQPPYSPEEVWTYELGVKAVLLSGRLRTDAAIFHSDYTEYQIYGLLPAESGVIDAITSNAGDARLEGMEWGLSWHAGNEWSFSFNGNYVKSKFTDINATSTAYIVGDRLDLTPKYGYNLSAEREFSWGNRPGFARLDYSQQGRSTYRNRNVLGPTGEPTPWYFSESDVINTLNFNAGVQYSDSLSLNLFAQNLLNDRGYTDPFSVEDYASRSRPRSFGVGFSVRFD